MPRVSDAPLLRDRRPIKPQKLVVRKTSQGWEIRDSKKKVRVRITTADAPIKHWSDQMGPPPPTFSASVFPDGKTSVPFVGHGVFFGDSFLVAAVLSASGVRNVYLPAGDWVDLWTGKVTTGPVLLRNVKSPLERIPVYAVRGATVRVYPERVQCTDQMQWKKCAKVTLDKGYRGLGKSKAGGVAGL